MKEEDLMRLSIELRRKIYDHIREFWNNNKDSTNEQIFFINSVVMSSLIAQMTYTLFKKNIGNDAQSGYIDEICTMAKKQLKEGIIDKE